MAMMTVTAKGTTPAPPAAVFTLLKASRTWPRWSMIGSYEMVRPGTDEPDGVGAVRCFRTGIVTAVEEIVEIVPDRRISYILKSGLPLKDYRARTDLAPLPDGGTAVTWQSSFRPEIPGTGWLFRLFMTYVLTQLTAALCAAAENPENAPY